jgi:phospholipid transport system substrate-binding protein
MRTFPVPILIVAVMLGSACSSAAWAGPPTDQLRGGMERILKILVDPELAGEANAPRRSNAVARIAGDIFDFVEMSRRALGQHWEQRTPAEREDFARLFTDLVQRSYFSKIDEHGSEKTIFRAETVDGNRAVVRTTLLFARGVEMPLDYAMIHAADRWRVYDLSIDGVGLVANYRSQFDRIIRTASYEGLLTRMKSHQAEVTSSPASSPEAK